MTPVAAVSEELQELLLSADLDTERT
jgi:hypothetical protein